MPLATLVRSRLWSPPRRRRPGRPQGRRRRRVPREDGHQLGSQAKPGHVAGHGPQQATGRLCGHPCGDRCFPLAQRYEGVAQRASQLGEGQEAGNVLFAQKYELSHEKRPGGGCSSRKLVEAGAKHLLVDVDPEPGAVGHCTLPTRRAWLVTGNVLEVPVVHERRGVEGRG